MRQQTPPSYYFVTGPPQQLAALYMPRPIEDHLAYENPFAAEKIIAWASAVVVLSLYPAKSLSADDTFSWRNASGRGRSSTELSLRSASSRQQPIGTPTHRGEDLSATDTVAYINKQLTAYQPTYLEINCGLDQWRQTISLSSDHHYILLGFPKTANKICTGTQAILILDAMRLNYGKADGIDNPINTGHTSVSALNHATVWLQWDCSADGVGVYENGVEWKNYWYGDVEGRRTCAANHVGIFLNAQPEIAERVGRAFLHLVATLNAEGRSKVPDKDPFANPN